MQKLSYTQQYYLCAVNNKGSIPTKLATFAPACLLVGGILELLHHGYILRDEKGKLHTGQEWDNQLPYLEPLYETIVKLKKPRDIRGVAEQYGYGLGASAFSKYFSAIGISLVESGDADETSSGNNRKQTKKYLPKRQSVQQVVEKIRSEILEDKEVCEETICLLAFLEKSNMLRDYFSKFEANDLKARIKDIKKSDSYASIKKVIDDLEAMVTALIAVLVILVVV
jgi:hypothetical protein